MTPPLVDSFGRIHDNLRISVTDLLDVVALLTYKGGSADLQDVAMPKHLLFNSLCVDVNPVLAPEIA